MDLELPPYPGRDVITLHDVVAWRFDDEAPPVPAAAQEARQAAAVICVSNFTAQEAKDFLGVRDPHVVHNGVNPRFFDAEPLDDLSLRGLGIRQPYVLTMGGASKRKNLAGLADAWPLIHAARPDLNLVLAGPPHPRRTELFQGLPDVQLVGRVADDLVPGLLAAAAVLIVPSLYEGFGLPALEGMAANVPVVAARTSALPEVVGDGGVLVEPTADELAEGTLWAASGDSEIAEMVRRGRARAGQFTWERSALEHARVWASLV
jgi:glycosyltransferase involved in cell wall biosynthesis